MKKTLFILTIMLAAGVSAFAQNDERTKALEQEIRRLDRAQAEAILRKDYDALDRLCTEDFTTNSPRNELVKSRGALKELMRRGVVNYTSFTREIETILIYEKTAVVMGREIVVTNAAGAAQAAQTLQRRFTNVWIRRGGEWLLTARHASIIPPAN